MRKKILLAILTILSLVSIVFLFVSFQRKNQSKTNIAPPKINNYLNQKLGIKIQTTEENFNFPRELPVLIVRNANTEKIDFEQVSRNLGFTINYSTFTDSQQGEIYLWKESGMSLLYYPRNSHFVYTKATDEANINQGLTDEAITNISKDFLIQNFREEEETLLFPEIQFLELNDEGFSPTTKQNASVYKITYSPVINNLKIVEPNPQDSPINVWMSLRGDITKVETKRMSDFSNSNENYKIKNFTELNNTLSESIIVNVGDGEIIPQDLRPGSVGEINIDKIQLAYLRDTLSSNLYQPIFILAGSANITTKGVQKVILYLPAISKNQP